MNYYCQYCDKSYSNKQNLVKHQKTKSCVKNQTEKIINFEEELQMKNKEISDLQLQFELQRNEESKNRDLQLQFELQSKKELNSKIEELNAKIEEQQSIINQLKEDNIKLQTRLEVYMEQKEEHHHSIHITNNNNTTIIDKLQVFNLNPDSLFKTANRHFTLDYLKQENRGVAKFALKYIMRDPQGKFNYICTDPSRKIGKYKIDDNTIVTDFGMETLTDIVYKSIKIPINKLVLSNLEDGKDLIEDKNYKHQQNINKNSPEFINEVAKCSYIKNIKF